MKKMNKQRGITLVALVITIIVLLILTGVTINELTGEGLIKKALEAREENQKNTASETMKLKITAAQMQSYAEKQEMATLEYLYNYLKNDNDMEYVETTSQAVGDTGDTFAGIESIYAKLAAYPYEFGINSDLELASINGVKVATATDSKIEELESKVNTLETVLGSMATELNETKTQLSTYATKSEVSSTYVTKENADSSYASIDIERNSLNGFDVLYSGSADATGTYDLTFPTGKNLSSYKKLIFYTDGDWEASGDPNNGYIFKQSVIVEPIANNKSCEYISNYMINSNINYYYLVFTLSSSTQFRIDAIGKASNYSSVRIYKVEGLY